MKVQVEELSPIERKLSIEVPPEQVRAELDRAYTQLSRHVKVAGFRPGKVPRRILEQRYKDQVEDDVIQRVVELSYRTAISEHKVEAVASPRVTNGGLVHDAPFSFEARVEVKPKIEVKDFEGLPLKKGERTVEDAKVTEQLEQLRQGNSRMEPVEDRKVAQSGDFATVSYEATVDGAGFQGNQAQNVTVEVAAGDLLDSKIAALEGVELGGTKELDYAFPADYPADEVKGKVARFKVTLNGLKRKVVPELNDDFAKEVGDGVESMEALRKKIREGLEKAADSRAQSEEREALLAALIERNPFEVPSGMVERALDVMLEGALRNLSRSGLDPRTLNLDFDALRNDLRERAVREVKGALLLEALAKQKSLEATDADLDARLEALAQEAGQPLAAVKKHFRSPEQRESLGHRVREEKAVEFLKARAKYS